jgi:hypothetical protein
MVAWIGRSNLRSARNLRSTKQTWIVPWKWCSPQLGRQNLLLRIWRSRRESADGEHRQYCGYGSRRIVGGVLGTGHGRLARRVAEFITVTNE